MPVLRPGVEPDEKPNPKLAAAPINSYRREGWRAEQATRTVSAHCEVSRLIEHFNSFRAVLHLKRSKKLLRVRSPVGREWRTSDTEPAVRLPASAMRWS